MLPHAVRESHAPPPRPGRTEPTGKVAGKAAAAWTKLRAVFAHWRREEGHRNVERSTQTDDAPPDYQQVISHIEPPSSSLCPSTDLDTVTVAPEPTQTASATGTASTSTDSKCKCHCSNPTTSSTPATNENKPGQTASSAAERDTNPPLPELIIRTSWPGGSPPWEQAAERNKQHSPLYRLPQHILIKTLLLLPSEDLCVLRVTSALFTQVCSLPAFSRHRDPTSSPDAVHTRRDVWQYRIRGWADAPGGPVWQRLRRHLFCRSCAAFCESGEFARVRERLITRRLYCAGCRAEHEAVYFSAGQKDPARATDADRICAGWEGRVNSCEHTRLAWVDVVPASWDDCCPNSRGVDYRILDCVSIVHDQFREDKEGKIARVIAPPELKVWLTADESADRPLIANAVSTYRACLFSVTRSRFGHLFQFGFDNMVGALGVLQGYIRAVGRDLATGLPVSYPQVCPHMQLDDGKLLEPFWPSSCACFGWSMPPWRAYPRTNQRLLDSGSVDSGSRCWHRGRLKPELRGQWLPVQPGLMPVPELEDAGAQKTRSVELECACDVCGTSYTWEREGGIFYVKTKWQLSRCSSPLDPQWLLLVDPASWRMDEDPETRGLLWCPDKGCVTGSGCKEFVAIVKT